MHTSSWWGYGEKDLDGNVVADTRYHYQWWRDSHCPMGTEGLDAGLYMIRPSFENFLGDKFMFKVGSRAVVQHRSGFLSDLTFYMLSYYQRGYFLDLLFGGRGTIITFDMAGIIASRPLGSMLNFERGVQINKLNMGGIPGDFRACNAELGRLIPSRLASEQPRS